MKNYIFIVLLLALIALSGCICMRTSPMDYNHDLFVDNNVLVGGDEDEHGCKASAGYTWCPSANKCVRTWEEPCLDLNNACSNDFRGSDVCTMEYFPVCGNKSDGSKENYGNICMACSNEEVENYTIGECS